MLSKGKDLFFIASFVHLIDATQVNKLIIFFIWFIICIIVISLTKGNNAGIIRAVGGQFASTIMYLIAFYMIGLPVGLCLMLLTSLTIRGISYSSRF